MGDDSTQGGAGDAELAAIAEVLVALDVAPGDVPSTAAEAAAMVPDVVLARDDTLRLDELAARAELTLDQTIAILRFLGIGPADATVVRFSEADVELMRFFDRSLRILTEREGRELLHVIGVAMGSAAEAAVTSHVQGPESRTANWLDGARLAETMAEVGLELGTHLAAVFRHHLRQAIARQRRVQSNEFRELHHLTIGFVDLVGFTTLSQTLAPHELVGVVTDFELRAHEIAHDVGVRVVKLIGDEVMFAGESVSRCAEFALGMVEAFTDGSVVPRGGLSAGAVISVHGDYFGPVVNLAARLVDEAVPGEILVDDAVASDPGVAVEPAGRRMLKGFEQPVRVHGLRRETGSAP